MRSRGRIGGAERVAQTPGARGVKQPAGKSNYHTTTEERVRVSNPDLRLHAYVLSVTPPDQIGDELRPQDEWEKEGVYFLSEPDCLRQVIDHALR